MKAILCARGGELISLRSTETQCPCGASGGRYLDDNQAEFWGEAIPIAFSNAGLEAAVKANKSVGVGAQYFSAWVVGADSETFKRRVQ